MKQGRSSFRLRVPRIELKPKPVYAEHWQDFARIGKQPALKAELDDIIECIERGDGVPEQHYRAGIDRDRDGLLEDRGIMHLHLGGKHSDTLVFLVQYADRVVLLESNTHHHFETHPAGKNIVALVQSWFQNMEREMIEADERAKAEGTEQERRAAADLRDERAAAIEAFKARLKK